MGLINFCGWVAVGVSCVVVLLFVVLMILAVVCTGLGAYESYTNPNAAQDAHAEYLNVTSEINAGVSQMNHVEQNLTGGK